MSCSSPALKLMYPALASQFILLMLATSVVSLISAPICSTPPLSSIRAPSAISRSTRDRRGLPRPGPGLPPAVRRPLPGRLRPAMIREFAWIDVLYLIAAMRWTLVLTAVALLGGGLLGAVVALLRSPRLRAAALAGQRSTSVVQGTPLLAWLFVFFFGLPIFGFAVSPWTAAAASLSVYAAAFLGEIWRGACRRSRAPSGRPAPRSASASRSSCATSSCRRPSASPSRRPSAFWSS